MSKRKKAAALMLSAALLTGTAPAVFAAPSDTMTRGQAADLLLEAAQDYNPGVQRSDIIKGYADGSLNEDGAVTRVQAMIMLSRAFGGLPVPEGDNARSGYNCGNFTDIPVWAEKELRDVLHSGIVAGTGSSTFSPDMPVTEQQMDLLIHRVYALEGSDLKDDFYAAVNKEALDSSEILPGYTGTGGFTDLSMQVNNDVAVLIQEAAEQPKTAGEKKISVLYNNILNMEARNEEGIAPIKKYLDAIDRAATLKELMEAHNLVYDELGVSLLMGFGLTIDAKDSNVYDLTFAGVSASLGKSGYSGASAAQKDAYLTYIKTVFGLIGQDSGSAATQAQLIWNADAALADASLTNQELGDVDKTYNLFTMAQLQAMFPNVDLNALFDLAGYTQTDKIVVSDVNLLKAWSVYFDETHLDTLKAYCRMGLVSGFGATLNEEFSQAGETFNQAYLGVSGSVPLEDTAAQYVQMLMSDYLGEAYVKRHFSAKAKADAEKMVKDIISVYKDRIQQLPWMSDATKAEALRKLETMKLHIGYPDVFGDSLAGAELRSVAEGGSFFDNIVTMNKEYRKLYVEMQNAGVDKTAWAMTPDTVNACYDPTVNSITFPAAILQPPFYDVNAPYEENLGGIGYVIAHEITHAFDNNGAKYDINGNAADWWTAEDYAAFQQLCSRVVELYDGREAAPGIRCNGALTLSENIADLGAVACITQLEGKQAKPDYEALYTAAAKIWYSSYTREMKAYLTQVDVHAPDKLRGSLTMQNFKEFYETFNITEKDGMWLPPEERVEIW